MSSKTLKVAGLEAVRLIALLLVITMMPLPRSETDEVFIYLKTFLTGGAALIIYMLITCVIARRAPAYGLISTVAETAGMLCVFYVIMDYWKAIH